MANTSLSRRSFLTTSAATIAATSALALPASAQPVGANERINIGLIGTGGRCRHLMPALAKVPNTRMMALCDVYEPNLELAQKLAEAKAFTTRDYHALLARKDVHAVLIATPDHWHTPMTIDASRMNRPWHPPGFKKHWRAAIPRLPSRAM